MATPPITVENIRDRIPSFVDILNRYQTGSEAILERLEPHLEKLSSPEGMICTINNRPTRVHFGWNYDGDDTINGLFASIYQDDPNGTQLVAFKMVHPDRDCEVLLTSHHPGHSSTSHILQNQEEVVQSARFVQRFARFDIFFKGEVIPYKREVSFKSQWVGQEEVRAFYEKHPRILDSLVNSPVPPQLNPTESPDSDSNNYLLLGSVLLLLIGMAYAKSKYLPGDTEKASLPIS